MTAEQRLKICEQCPLVKIDSIFGPVCDSSKYMDPRTGEVSRSYRTGWVRGCACKLRWKTASPTAHCVAGKW